MANKPCIGGYICPHCGKKTVAAWDGNIENVCQHCRKRFIAKRQKMIDIVRVKRGNKEGSHE